MEQIRRIQRPTDVPDNGLLCDLLWADPDKNVSGWAKNNRGVSFTFGADVVNKFLNKHDLGKNPFERFSKISSEDLIVRAHQVVEDGYEFFAKRQLVTLFSAPNYCGEFDNAAAMMSVDEMLVCSFQIIKPIEEKAKARKHLLTSPQITNSSSIHTTEWRIRLLNRRNKIIKIFLFLTPYSNCTQNCELENRRNRLLSQRKYVKQK